MSRFTVNVPPEFTLWLETETLKLQGLVVAKAGVAVIPDIIRMNIMSNPILFKLTFKLFHHVYLFFNGRKISLSI